MEIEVDGGVAVVRSLYSMTFTLPSVALPLRERGKGVLVLRRGEEGSWRITIDVWNADAVASPEQDSHTGA